VNNKYLLLYSEYRITANGLRGDEVGDFGALRCYPAQIF